MKKAALFILSLFSVLTCRPQGAEPQGENPFLADPTIFFWDGVYYLYGTGGIKPQDGRPPHEGFLVYTSTDLENWSGPAGVCDGFALVKGESYGDRGFWAPQVFRYRDKFYMAYTANEQIAVASAPSPLGPFRQDELKPVSTATRQIDPFVFFDGGKIYMYHVRLTGGNRLFVAEMDADLKALDESTVAECISAEPGSWEDTQNVPWRVAEGPTIIKDDGKYYFFYSANDFRNIDYAVGYATAGSPLGPWVKYDKNPIIDRELVGWNGPGHGDIFFDGSGEMWYVLHTHFSNERVSSRRTAIIRIEKRDDGFTALPETFRFLLVTNK